MIIIMYIYHALINALSAHMIHINLNMILYTQDLKDLTAKSVKKNGDFQVTTRKMQTL